MITPKRCAKESHSRFSMRPAREKVPPESPEIPSLCLSRIIGKTKSSRLPRRPIPKVLKNERRLHTRALSCTERKKTPRTISAKNNPSFFVQPGRKKQRPIRRQTTFLHRESRSQRSPKETT